MGVLGVVREGGKKEHQQLFLCAVICNTPGDGKCEFKQFFVWTGTAVA